jgi:hypothetical protein
MRRALRALWIVARERDGETSTRRVIRKTCELLRGLVEREGAFLSAVHLLVNARTDLSPATGQPFVDALLEAAGVFYFRPAGLPPGLTVDRARQQEARSPATYRRDVKAALAEVDVDKVVDWLEGTLGILDSPEGFEGIEGGVEHEFAVAWSNRSWLSAVPPHAWGGDGASETSALNQPNRTRDQLSKPSGQGASARAQRETNQAAESKASPGLPPAEEYVFAPSGNVYYVAGFGESGHMTGLKGLAVIASLIKRPGDPVPMLKLIGADLRLANDRRSHQPALDDEARQEARAQLKELFADRDRARQENNNAEETFAQGEINRLMKALGSASGKSGKSRDLNNPLDRWRPTIYRRLQTVYDKMREGQMPKLAEHFELNITSEKGAFVYRPAGSPPQWRLHLTK